MLLLFQLLFTAFALFAIVSVIKKKHEQVLGKYGVSFWVVFWMIAGVVVWWPNATTIIANAFGIGRGADLIIYVSLIVLFYILFKLHVKIESVGRDVTQVVRDRAITHVESKNQ